MNQWLSAVERAAALLMVRTDALVDALARNEIDGHSIMSLDAAAFRALIDRELPTGRRRPLHVVQAALGVLIARRWAGAM